MKKIIHIDMDAYFASVEQLDHPRYRGKPLIVGGSPQSRGVVATCSYEARKFGVRSAMPTATAYRLCPQGIFVRPRFDRYVELSQKIRAIFNSVTPLVEPLSLDEAYLDVTENSLREPSATKVANYIKERIYNEIGLVASCGVGPNKMIAKIASDLEKPNALVTIAPDQVYDFLTDLPVGKIFGIGKKSEERLNKLDVFTIGDLRKFSKLELISLMGKWGPTLYERCRGIDHRAVQVNHDLKSVGNETTFSDDISDREQLKNVLSNLSLKVSERLKKKNKLGRTITIKIKYHNFKLNTRSKSLSYFINDSENLTHIAHKLLSDALELNPGRIRLLGLSVSHFSDDHKEGQIKMDFNS